MNSIVSVDTSVLEKKLSELIGLLQGRGAESGDLARALKTEAGQCAWSIAQAIGPRTKARGMASLDREMRTQFSIKPAYSNLSEEQQYSSTADFTWLAAGPHYLIGIHDEDNQVQASDVDAIQMFYAGRKVAPRGKAWKSIGVRGRQTVFLLNRIRITPSRFNAIKKIISEKFGEAKASFAATAAEYLKKKAIPAWVKNKIPAVRANGKQILDDTGLRVENPFIIFGSRSKGVESNPHMIAAIQNGINRSAFTLRAKIERILRGHIYNWNTGQVFRPTQFEDN